MTARLILVTYMAPQDVGIYQQCWKDVADRDSGVPITERIHIDNHLAKLGKSKPVYHGEARATKFRICYNEIPWLVYWIHCPEKLQINIIRRFFMSKA